MAIHSSILTWRIPWTEEPSELQSIGSHRFGQDWSDLAGTTTLLHVVLKGETEQDLLALLVTKTFCPYLLFVGNRLQPPWPSLSSKGQMWTVVNQRKEGIQRQGSVGSRCEDLHPWQRSWGRRLNIRKGGIEPQGSPWKFSSIYPYNQSLPTLLLCALTYTSDFMGGCPPQPLLEKELT